MLCSISADMVDSFLVCFISLNYELFSEFLIFISDASAGYSYHFYR